MRLILKTEVNQPLEQVKAGFNRKLFEALAPPFPKLRLLRFDGSSPGDRVELELNFGVKKQRWLSLITEEGGDPGTYYFVDEGQQLPAPLRNWRHKHILQSLPSGGTLIVDQVDFYTGKDWLDLLVYPGLLLQFLYRKPVYKRFFR